MGTRWDGKIGKIPKISDKREGKRFSPRLTGADPDFHECRSTPDIDEERTGGGNGREPGQADLYTPETVSQYKSQWARYQRALSLNPAAIVQNGKNFVYKFESCDALDGFWQVQVIPGATYLKVLKPILQILCPKPTVLDFIDSDAETFTWTQTRGSRTAELNGIFLKKEQSVVFGFNPVLDILSFCTGNGCSDNSVEPIVINVQPEDQPELFESIIIYTTPTSTNYGNSFACAVAAPDAAPCRQVPNNLSLNVSFSPPPVVYLHRGYEFLRGNLPVSWSLPTCDSQFLVDMVWQQNTTGQYLDVQRFSANALRNFVPQNNIHYRIRSTFNIHGRLSTSDSARFYFTSGQLSTGIGIAVDDNCKGVSFTQTKSTKTVLPLSRIGLNITDSKNGISFAQTESKKTVLLLSRVGLQPSADTYNGLSFAAIKTIVQKFELGGVIIR